jgi:hypothetical protein
MNGNGIVNESEWIALRIGESGAAPQVELRRVLLVGRADYSRVFDCLLSISNFQFSFVADYRELWAAPPIETLQLAVLFDSLHSFELEASCRLIRRRWPKAQILIFRSRMESLDKSLYDVRLAPNVAPQVLNATTLKLAGKPFGPRDRTFDRLHGT